MIQLPFRQATGSDGFAEEVGEVHDALVVPAVHRALAQDGPFRKSVLVPCLEADAAGRRCGAPLPDAVQEPAAAVKGGSVAAVASQNPFPPCLRTGRIVWRRRALEPTRAETAFPDQIRFQCSFNGQAQPSFALANTTSCSMEPHRSFCKPA